MNFSKSSDTFFTNWQCRGRVLAAALLMSLFSANLALANQLPIDTCSNDSYQTERIEENVPVTERLDVWNGKGQVVGAVHFDPPSGELHALYLCGRNNGYYYLRGNINSDLTAIYSDEYDAKFTTRVVALGIEVNIEEIRFSGDAEDADYQPFGGQIFIQKK